MRKSEKIERQIKAKREERRAAKSIERMIEIVREIGELEKEWEIAMRAGE